MKNSSYLNTYLNIKHIRYDMCALLFLIVIMCIWIHNNKETSYDDVPAFKEENAKEECEVKKIALTFDDGPHPVYTEQLLDGLSERGIKGTFFLLGKLCECYPEIVERIAQEGHLIGNHTYSHIQLTKNNLELFQEELIKTNELLEALTGQPVTYVRPPFGVWNKKLEENLNMIPVFWNIDPLDWCTSNSDNVCYRVTSKAKENAIVLLHDSYKSTVEATLKIIDELISEGFEFVTVDELLFD